MHNYFDHGVTGLERSGKTFLMLASETAKSRWLAIPRRRQILCTISTPISCTSISGKTMSVFISSRMAESFHSLSWISYRFANFNFSTPSNGILLNFPTANFPNFSIFQKFWIIDSVRE
ncbi:hypothetical protein AX14_012449 [Amanita brunnescens Koide BX004]|nr:hypothetical protein AX14_012449 [Amanita brunnescens Koide BX004]